MPPLLETSDVGQISRRPKPGLFQGVLLLVFGVVLLFTGIYFLSQPPSSFVSETVFTIDEGMSVGAIAKKAKREGLVQSSLILYATLTYIHDPTGLFAGNYLFENPVSVFDFAEKLASGDIEPEVVVLTIPEGTRVSMIAELAETALEEFSAEEFTQIATPFEGYLFPETYYVPKDFTEADLLALMRKTYTDTTTDLKPLLSESTLSEYEVLTLASILEREANDEASMKTVSGILQNRLEIGMALQADASIEYELDNPLGSLTPEDLEIDSPYNTYLNTGLVPTPIGNPGLTAIKAVLEPISTDYLFYITGNNGTFYYARTYEEHQDNIALYLK